MNDYVAEGLGMKGQYEAGFQPTTLNSGAMNPRALPWAGMRQAVGLKLLTREACQDRTELIRASFVIYHSKFVIRNSLSQQLYLDVQRRL